MDSMDYEKVERQLREDIYNLSDDQKEQLFHSMLPHIQTSSFKVAVISSFKVKKTIEEILKTNLSGQDDPLLAILQRSAVWKDLDKKMVEFGKKQLADALSIFKP